MCILVTKSDFQSRSLIMGAHLEYVTVILQRCRSQLKLSLLTIHELSLAVRLFPGPSTATALGTSEEAKYLKRTYHYQQDNT